MDITRPARPAFLTNARRERSARELIACSVLKASSPLRRRRVPTPSRCGARAPENQATTDGVAPDACGGFYAKRWCFGRDSPLIDQIPVRAVEALGER